MQLVTPTATEDVPEAARVGDGAGDDDWADFRRELWRRPVNRRTVRERLLALIGAVRERLVDARPLSEEWRGMGVEVREVAIDTRGYCSSLAGPRVVYVNDAESYEVQRFTVAHEVAHLLLASDRHRQPPLSPWGEEMLCEEFAGRLLVDRDLLARRLPTGAPPAPDDLLRLCGQFRVNVRPMLIAVGEQLAETPYCLLLSRYRGHWRRPDERDFRIDGVAGARHVYFPPHQRLHSLGFEELAERAKCAPHGALLRGRDQRVSVGLRRLPGKLSSMTLQRNVTWQAIRQGHESPFLLAVLNLDSRTPIPGSLGPRRG